MDASRLRFEFEMTGNKAVEDKFIMEVFMEDREEPLMPREFSSAKYFRALIFFYALL